MPKPWEVTPEEARKWGERNRERSREAYRQDLPQFFEQTKDLEWDLGGASKADAQPPERLPKPRDASTKDAPDRRPDPEPS